MAKKTMSEAFDEAVWTTDDKGALVTTVDDVCEYGDDFGQGEFEVRIFPAADGDGFDIYIEHSHRSSALDGSEYVLETIEDAKAAVLSWLENWEQVAEQNLQRKGR